jgi:hypothetical protein
MNPPISNESPSRRITIDDMLSPPDATPDMAVADALSSALAVAGAADLAISSMLGATIKIAATRMNEMIPSTNR